MISNGSVGFGRQFQSHHCFCLSEDMEKCWAPLATSHCQEAESGAASVGLPGPGLHLLLTEWRMFA